MGVGAPGALSTVPLSIVSMLTQMDEKSSTLESTPILDMTVLGLVFWASGTSIINQFVADRKFGLLDAVNFTGVPLGHENRGID